MIHRSLLGDAWENATAAVAVVGDDGRYIACNETFCRLTGYTREEINGVRVDGGDGLRRKDGTVVEASSWALETTVSGLPYRIVLYSDVKETSTS
jgi:PAS domain-containing protein